MEVLILTYANQVSYPSWEAELVSSYFTVELMQQLVS